MIFCFFIQFHIITIFCRKITQGTSNFFGLQEDQGYMDEKWNARLKQLYGKSGMFALKG